MSRNYAMGHCFTGKDLFNNFPLNKLKMSKEQCVATYPDGSKRDLAASIFTRSVQIVVDDIINNNVDFLTSNFSGYQIVLDMESKKRTTRQKDIYLSPKDRDRITENTNLGKQY